MVGKSDETRTPKWLIEEAEKAADKRAGKTPKGSTTPPPKTAMEKAQQEFATAQEELNNTLKELKAAKKADDATAVEDAENAVNEIRGRLKKAEKNILKAHKKDEKSGGNDAYKRNFFFAMDILKDRGHKVDYTLGKDINGYSKFLVADNIETSNYTKKQLPIENAVAYLVEGLQRSGKLRAIASITVNGETLKVPSGYNPKDPSLCLEWETFGNDVKYAFGLIKESPQTDFFAAINALKSQGHKVTYTTDMRVEVEALIRNNLEDSLCEDLSWRNNDAKELAVRRIQELYKLDTKNLKNYKGGISGAIADTLEWANLSGNAITTAPTRGYDGNQPSSALANDLIHGLTHGEELGIVTSITINGRKIPVPSRFDNQLMGDPLDKPNHIENKPSNWMKFETQISNALKQKAGAVTDALNGAKEGGNAIPTNSVSNITGHDHQKHNKIEL